MDPLTAIGLVTTAVQLFMKLEPVAASAIKNFKPYAIALYEKLTGKPIGDEERATLEANIDEMHLSFQRPIPPEDQQ